MSVLVFCTGFAQTQDTWRSRYRRWVDTLRRSSVRFDQLLIVDDGSPVLPDWPDLAIVEEREGASPAEMRSKGPLVLFHFQRNLGRSGIYAFPGWYRSFAFAAQYAEAAGFDKVLHLESDAVLISKRIQNYANLLQGGWTVLWCPKFDFPEIAIQVIVGREINSFAQFTRQPYSSIVNKVHETMLPYTYVEKNFTGDRYGESLTEVPRGADYANQVPAHREDTYYWWDFEPPTSEPAASATSLTEISGVASADEMRDGEFTIAFGDGGNSDQYVGTGWSHVEASARWMIGEESEINLPPLSPDSRHMLLLWITPIIHAPTLTRQRLRIEVDGATVKVLEMDAGSVLGFEVPPNPVQGAASTLVTFFHPDAASPASLTDSTDHRRLAFSIERLVIKSQRRSEAGSAA